MMDRMDCQLLMTTFNAFYYFSFIAISSHTVDKMMYYASQMSAEDQYVLWQEVRNYYWYCIIIYIMMILDYYILLFMLFLYSHCYLVGQANWRTLSKKWLVNNTTILVHTYTMVVVWLGEAAVAVVCMLHSSTTSWRYIYLI